MYQVIKRDGRLVDFDLARIANAITKAFDATEIPYNTDIIDLLALQVTADYAGKVKNNEIGVEDIQDSVEAVLQRRRLCVCGEVLYPLPEKPGETAGDALHRAGL